MGVHLGQAKWKSRRYANKDAENVATYAAPLRLLCLLIRKCAIWRSPNRCRAQLAKTLRHVAVLKRRVADLQARIANNTELSQKHKERARAFRHRIAIQSEQLAQALDKNASQRRSMLSKRVIRQHLPLRASVTRARVDGPARETTFLEASAAYAEALAAAASPPGDPRLLHTDLLGLHWWVPILRKGDDLPSSAWLVKQRFPYRVITQTRELGLGGIMLDLGANLGRMSISRVLLGDVTAAYCAEPDPVNYACLVRNIVSNGLRGLVLADCVAIGAAQGFARMRVGRWSGAHSLVGTGTAVEGVKIEVPVVTLDAWVSRLCIDLDLVSFVKVDIQGWEGHMFAGATEVLGHRHIVWQVEYDPSLLRVAGTDPADVRAVFRQYFSHFTDLNKDARGERGRPIAEVNSAVEYVCDQGSTDLLLFNLA